MSQAPNQHEPDIVDTLFAYLDRFMDELHDRVLRPILLVGRFLAFGFILFLLLLVIVSALVIGFVRFSTIYLFDHRVWITYLVISAITTATGMVIWRKRRPVTFRKQ